MAVPADIRGQNAAAGEPTDGIPASDAALTDAETNETEEQPIPATFRVNVVDFLRPEWEQELSMGTVNVIIPDDFKGEQKKLPEYLDMVPGLHVERRGGEGQYSTVTMRGSTSAQVTIYVDGVPQNFGIDGAIDLSLIPVSNVARIEIYRGYIPARFSGAPIGGVINIVTKKPQGFDFSVSSGARSFTGKSTDGTFTAPLFGGSLLMGFHHERSDGDFGYELKPPVDSAGTFYPYVTCGIEIPCWRTRKSNSYKMTDALIKWQNENWYSKFAWKETSRFFPNATNYGGSALGEFAVDSDMPYTAERYLNGYTFYRYQKADQYDLLLGRRQTWGNLEWGAEANYTKQDKFYEMKDFTWRPDLFNAMYGMYAGSIWNDYNTKRFGVNLDGSYRLGERQMFEFRADYFNEKLGMDGNINCAGSNANCNFHEGGGYTHGNGPMAYKRNAWHIQGSDTITLNDKKDLWLTFIARWDKAADENEGYFANTAAHLDEDNRGVFTWGVALKKEIGNGLTFRGTGGSYVRHPNFYELFGDGVVVVPNLAAHVSGVGTMVGVRPEVGYQWDFGGDWRGGFLNTRANLSATYFSRLTARQIYPVITPIVGYIRYENIGAITAHGMEFDGGFNWNSLTVNGSATWQKSMLMGVMGYQAQLITGNPLTLMPVWETHIRGEYGLRKNLSLFAEHHFTGSMLEQFSYTLNSAEIVRDPMNVTGAGLRLKTPWGFTLVSGVDDIFDRRLNQKFTVGGSGYQYGRWGMYPSPGRTWYVTLDYLLGRGSASDSSGKGSVAPKPVPGSGAGSADPKPATGTMPNFMANREVPAAGEATNRGRLFYVAPKMIYTRQRVKFAERAMTATLGNILPNANFGYFLPEDIEPLPPFDAREFRNNILGGGMAIGVDLYERFNLPLRLEIEASLPQASKTRGVTSPPYMRGGYGIVSVSRNAYWLSYRTYSAFFNTYYDFHNRTRFTPYVGAGAGLSFVSTDVITFITGVLANGRNPPGLPEIPPFIPPESGENPRAGYQAYYFTSSNDRDFAWNAAAGVSYRLTKNIDFDVSYRFVDTGFSGRKGKDLEDKWGEPYNTEGLYSMAFTIQTYNANMRRQDQAVFALRFRF